MEGFLTAQNHVWRYTLRLFNTVAIFDKSRKINDLLWLRTTFGVILFAYNTISGF